MSITKCNLQQLFTKVFEFSYLKRRRVNSRAQREKKRLRFDKNYAKIFAFSDFFMRRRDLGGRIGIIANDPYRIGPGGGLTIELYGKWVQLKTMYTLIQPNPVIEHVNFNSFTSFNAPSIGYIAVEEDSFCYLPHLKKLYFVLSVLKTNQIRGLQN